MLDSYKELCAISEEVCKTGEEHKRILAQLQDEKEKLLSTNSELQGKVTLLTSKLESMTKSIRMLNNGSDVLDEILQIGERGGRFTSIGFNYQFLNNKRKPPVTKFVSVEVKDESTMADQMLQHSSRLQKTHTRIKF